MKYLLFSMPFLVLAGCATNANNAVYKKNLATAQAVLAAHAAADYDTWMTLHHEDAVIWDADYGSESMTRDEAALLYASHHEAIDGIDGSDAVWLPGVDTLSLEADGSVRAYINWKGTAVATGVSIDLRAYHYWNFKDGKVVAEGNYYDAGGLIAAASPATTTLSITHEVEDFDRWAEAWVEGSENVKNFADMGVTARIFQSTDPKRPKDVNILFDIIDMEAWNAAQGTPEMVSNAESHGVIMKTIASYEER
jgi:ketosteroid isomerase-like protein